MRNRVQATFYLLLAYTLLLLIPVSFQPTVPYLDAAWGYGLNYFLHSGFRFGPDVIFTYGPLGFLNNPQHIANDIQIALAVHALFWAFIGIQLVSVWRSGRRPVAIAFCVALLLGHRIYYDYWDFDLLALGLISATNLFRGRATYFDFALFPVLTGIGFLFKFTAFSTMVCLVVAYTAHVLVSSALSKRTGIWLIVCFASAPLAYLIYNPSAYDLYLYSKGILQIAAGFTTAMSTESEPINLELAAIVALLLTINLAVAVWNRRILAIEALLLLAVAWTAFRQGFVRADSSHVALFFGFSLLVFSYLFTGWRGVKWPEVMLSVSCVALAAACLVGLNVRYRVLTASNWWPGQGLEDLKMLYHPTKLFDILDHQSDSQFALLPGMAFRSLMEGQRVMVFPLGTPYVAKMQFQMFPIYSLQDYAANTSYLDNKGARNLLEAHPAVDKILLEWISIDGRNLMLDTPAMSMAFLSHFEPEASVASALLLKRRTSAITTRVALIGHQDFKADAWVPIPFREKLVAMSIRLQQSVMGSLVTGIYRQEAVYIDIENRSGQVKHFRVAPQTLRTPGVINYVPDSLDDLQKLWSKDALPGRMIRVRLSGPGLRWTTSKGYDFYEVENPSVALSN